MYATVTTQPRAAKWLTWTHCAIIVGTTLALGLIVGMWWPLWLLPPHMADTENIYLALSQVWLLVLIVCIILRPRDPGRRTLSNVVAVGWPLSALYIFLLLGGIWSKVTDAIQRIGISTTVINILYLLVWVALIVYPVLIFNKWLRAGEEKILWRLVGFLIAGIVVAVIYALSVLFYIGLAGGGFFTSALTCDAPKVIQGELTYTCQQNGMFDFHQDFELKAIGGLPIGQLQNVTTKPG